MNGLTAFHNHYEVLGIAVGSDPETVRKAYRSLSKTLHPDTTVLPPDKASLRFQRVCEAYAILGDPISRREYDKILDEFPLSEGKVSFRDSNPFKTHFKKTEIGDRRQLSGGELFSLLLLGIAIVVSLLLGIVFAISQGKELQVQPVWLYNQQEFNTDNPQLDTNVDFTSSSNAFKPAFITFSRGLVR